MYFLYFVIVLYVSVCLFVLHPNCP